MSLEVENPGGTESPNRLSLKRHDSLFGDAEKVSGGKYHGSEVCPSCNLQMFCSVVPAMEESV